MRRSRGAWVLTPLLLLAACDGDLVSPVARDIHDTPLARTPAASAGVVEMVTGSGHYDPGILSTYSFHAIRYADGRVQGHYQVRRHPLGSSGPTKLGNIQIHH